MKKLILIFIFIPNILFAGSMKTIGTKGNKENVDRVIKVEIFIIHSKILIRGAAR